MLKINKHRFNNYIFSTILFEFRHKLWFFIIIEFSKNPLATLRQTRRDADFGRNLRLGTTAVHTTGQRSAITTQSLILQQEVLVARACLYVEHAWVQGKTGGCSAPANKQFLSSIHKIVLHYVQQVKNRWSSPPRRIYYLIWSRHFSSPVGRSQKFWNGTT
jgi:hypothetical protein